MAEKLSKRMKAIREQVSDKSYLTEEALTLLKNLSKTKFLESVDAAVQ